MASTNKTSLGLNLWEASDKPVRIDFNNDNQRVTDKINIINDKIIQLTNDLTMLSNTNGVPLTVVTQSNYSISSITCYQKAGWVQFTAAVSVATPYNEHPGTPCYRSLPKPPASLSATFVQWASTFTSERALRVYIDTTGTLAIRNGIAGKDYIVNLSYPIA